MQRSRGFKSRSRKKLTKRVRPGVQIQLLEEFNNSKMMI